MKSVEPQVFLIGETRIIDEELQIYLDEVGASEWTSDAPSGVEKVIEVMGRLCYRSFKPGLNPNVRKIREGNDVYLANIIKIGHGSVIEHGFINFILHNVSRVFTHELVRHRVGVAISQESLRFVRLTSLRFWMSHAFKEHPKNNKLAELATEIVEYLEQKQVEFGDLLDLDNEKSFHVKKKLTSAMRRFAPIGLATTIGWSVNPRTLRNVIEMRTDPGAEEEIRLVFGMIAEKVIKRYPNVFGDYETEEVEGLLHYKTSHRKV